MHPKHTGGYWSFDLYYIGETAPAASGESVEESSEKQILLDLHNEARSELSYHIAAYFLFRRVMLPKIEPTPCIAYVSFYCKSKHV